MKASSRCTRPQYVCSNEKIKLIGGIDGYFPDFGHHLENEMGGLWLYPLKLLDGFWMHFTDETGKLADCWMKADAFENFPQKCEFSYGNGLGHTPVTATRTELAPEGIKGIIVRYTFENHSAEPVKCATRFLARVNLRPCWLSEKVGLFDHKDEAQYLAQEQCFLAKDSGNPWYTAISCSPYGEQMCCGDFFGPEITKGNGISCAVEHHFTLAGLESKTITFYISGSERSAEEALEQLTLLKENRDYEAEKTAKYDQVIARSRLQIPDKRFQEIFDWLKVHTNWLILDQDHEGRGLMAGIPEYPWWFGCDSCYALQGVLAMGDFELCRDTLKLLCDYSAKHNGNGRIVHEILPNGYCPNPGNTQETAHFISTVWKYYELTGDWSLVQETFPYLEKSIAWLQAQDADNDLFPSGYGIIEIAGLNMEMIDTAAYTCEAYGCYAKMLKKIGRTAESEKNFALYERVRAAINENLWDDRAGLYCDAYASYNTVSQKLNVLEKLIANCESEEIRSYIRTLLEERRDDGCTEKGWLLNRNWVINTPMETGIAPPEKANRALARMRQNDFIGRYGMYLDALTQRSVMTINTGVMAVAQAMYGHSDEALRLIEKTFDTYSMATPGSISEMSPDYGCFVQAWTAYGTMETVVRHFFGIRPSASEGKIVISPQMPESWGSGCISNVRVLDGTIDVRYEKLCNRIRLTIRNSTSYPVSVIENGNMSNEIVLLYDDR
ncbi:MAG: hypothetical protein IJZ39_00705 [Oscillospiraceae bacterium]|nr:hypothetical protein [Oscillospiraceae bacterium]